MFQPSDGEIPRWVTDGEFKCRGRFFGANPQIGLNDIDFMPKVRPSYRAGA